MPSSLQNIHQQIYELIHEDSVRYFLLIKIKQNRVQHCLYFSAYLHLSDCWDLNAHQNEIMIIFDLHSLGSPTYLITANNMHNKTRKI